MATPSFKEQANTSSILTNIKHEVLDIEAVKVTKNFPKRMTEKALQATMRTVSRIGQQLMPILVDDSGQLIAGFEILTAMRELGASKI
jgi:hypothetical protein